MPKVDPDSVPLALVSRLPITYAKQHKILPIAEDEDTIYVAVADPFDTEAKASLAFGKLNPNQYGILPVLVILQNDGDQTLTLEGMRLEYILPTRQHLEATPAREVPYTRGTDRPKVYSNPLPIPRAGGLKKNPLNAWEIEGRAFSAKMLPPGQSASGFFYFQASSTPGSVLYLTGIREASSRRELFYMEIPFDK